MMKFILHFQLILVWSSLILSIVNFVVLSKKSNQTKDKSNSSFHRLDSEVNSDVSDDSEVESELNSSLRSNLSSFSKRSLWNETKVLNSTLSMKTPSVYSMNSLRQRPITSIKTSEIGSSLNLNRSFHRGSQLDLTQDRLNTSQRSLIVSQTPDIFNGRQCPSAMSFNSLNKTFNSTANSIRSPSRNSMYDIPNDFESGITRLSISELNGRNTDAKKQSHVFGSTDGFGEAMRQRKTVLSPSRLSLNEIHQPGNQSSWLAGGYWNSTSPQKKFPHHVNNYKTDQFSTAKDVYPIISRASSKSSGFESRENSLCDDTEIERTFVFSEPSALTHSAKMTNELIKPQAQKPINQFIGMNGGNYYQPSTPISFASTPVPDLLEHSFGNSSKISPNLSMISHSFDRFSLKPNHIDGLKSNQFELTLNNINRIKKDLPMSTFQRGSLIKLHESANMDQ